MGLPISKTPEPETPRKPIQAVVPDHCYCGHSAAQHRGPDLGKNGGPCTVCRCQEYKRRPCSCGHSYATHNQECTVGGCACLRFSEDMSPAFLLHAGYSHWNWRYATVSQLRFLQRPDQVVRVRIWATILIHAAIGKRQRLPEEEQNPGAWLALKKNSNSGKYEPLQPVDIENELNEINRAAGEDPVEINSRREFRILEEQGAIARETGRGLHGNVKIFFLLEPGPYRGTPPPDEDSETAKRTDLSVWRLANSLKTNEIQNEIVIPVQSYIVNKILQTLKKHHVEEVLSIPDISVRVAAAVGNLPGLRESVHRALFEADLLSDEILNVSKGKADNPDRSVTHGENLAFSREENAPYKKGGYKQEGLSSSSAVKDLYLQKAEEEEDTPHSSQQSLEPAAPPYSEFQKFYPSKKLDDAKARALYNALPPIERRWCFQGLLDHLICERWVKSLANNDGKYIPLASTFISRREYAGDPPPHIDITTPLSPAERRQRQKNEQLANSARELYERLLKEK